MEPFFHEWRPDLDGTNSDLTSVLVAHEYYLKHQGGLSEDSPYRYETDLEMRHRFLSALEKYKNYKNYYHCNSRNAHAAICTRRED